MSDQRVMLAADMAIPACGELFNSHDYIPTSKAVLDALSELPLLTIDVDLTADEIKALSSAPKELIAAPGAGKVIDLVSVIAFLDFVTPAYDTSTVTPLITVGGTMATLTSAWVKSTEDTVAKPLCPAGVIVPTVNTACMLSVATTDYATGNSTMRISLAYRIIQLW